MKSLKQLSTVMQVKNQNGKVKIKYVTSLLAGYTVLSDKSISLTLRSAIQHFTKESQKTNS